MRRPPRRPPAPRRIAAPARKGPAMRALLIYCHPSPESFNHAIAETVTDRLRRGGAEVRVLDLYAEDFDPVMTRPRWEGYDRGSPDHVALAAHVEALRWADTLVFVYPTWWYGPPAMLKGWLDRAMLPSVAFNLPETGPITPALTHIRRLAVFTTCGASRWLTWAMGSPGRRILLRGLRSCCAPTCRRHFAAHYAMDASTPESRARHLARVVRECDRMLTGAGLRGARAPAGASAAAVAGRRALAPKGDPADA